MQRRPRAEGEHFVWRSGLFASSVIGRCRAVANDIPAVEVAARTKGPEAPSNASTSVSGRPVGCAKKRCLPPSFSVRRRGLDDDELAGIRLDLRRSLVREIDRAWPEVSGGRDVISRPRSGLISAVLRSRRLPSARGWQRQTNRGSSGATVLRGDHARCDRSEVRRGRTAIARRLRTPHWFAARARLRPSS